MFESEGYSVLSDDSFTSTGVGSHKHTFLLLQV